jgi:hypothetical protein
MNFIKSIAREIKDVITTIKRGGCSAILNERKEAVDAEIRALAEGEETYRLLRETEAWNIFLLAETRGLRQEIEEGKEKIVDWEERSRYLLFRHDLALLDIRIERIFPGTAGISATRKVLVEILDSVTEKKIGSRSGRRIAILHLFQELEEKVKDHEAKLDAEENYPSV